MFLGAMNNPNKSVAKEIARFGELGFDYMDLTAEAPQATPELLQKQEKQIRDALSTSKLKVVGHTPWFFEISHPYESIRKAVMAEMKASISACAKFGAEKVGIHPDPMSFTHPSRDKFLSVYSDSVAELNKHCLDLGVTLLIETYEDKFLKPKELEEIFIRLPDARFTLDVGHAFLNGGDQSIGNMVAKFSDQLLHVHASDNNGKEDLHLPIGAGKINWEKAIKALKAVGYDDTITLEIFSQDTEYLQISKEKFKALWQRE